MASDISSREKSTVLPLFVVDAFTSQAFKGNGAAVCLLQSKQRIPDDVKQQIAAEMNLSETAFVSTLQQEDTFEKGSRFSLRWFTPTCEVDLCGHATLATSAVLFFVYNNPSAVLEFQTASGLLRAERLTGNRIEIDLPAYASRPVSMDAESYGEVVKVAAGDLPVQEVLLSESGKLIVRLRDSVTRDQLECMEQPRPDALMSAASGLRGVIVTLKGGGANYDFVCRYFAPWLGVPEDPVTGSAHSVLAPYWSSLLNKRELSARQCSPRGGDLSVRLSGNRVAVAGHAKVVVRGQIEF